MSKDVECPYCGKEQNINHDDGYGYQDDEVHQQCCSYCDNTFVYTTYVRYIYTADKADCLNGGEHNWKPTVTYPKEFTKMRCTVCDEDRELTESEREQYLH